jgi:hypothetical protein
MKLHRLLGYAAAGVITGLLIENKTLVAKQYATAKARMLKKRAAKLVH